MEGVQDGGEGAFDRIFTFFLKRNNCVFETLADPVKLPPHCPHKFMNLDLSLPLIKKASLDPGSA